MPAYIFNMPYNESTPEGRENALRQRREWYHRNRKRVIKNNSNYRRKNAAKARTWLDGLKSTLKCKICSFDNPVALVFHHKNPAEKDATISECVASGWTIEKMKKEIEKCEVLCANCHYITHFS